ncbi:MAG: ribosome recycling factor [Candidatus Peregrinibacteria bacterium]
MTTQEIISGAVAEFEKALKHMNEEFSRLQVGRASSALVEEVPVEMYGTKQPIKALASISIPDPRTIQIQPWDKGALAPIEKGLVGIGTGFNPINDGICVRINLPPLTEERRVELTKKVRELAETAHVSIRTARQEAHNSFKDLKAKGDITEDDLFRSDKELQSKVEEYNEKVDEVSEAKEKDVMTV